MRNQKDLNVKRLRGEDLENEEESGVSWGMGFEDEEEIAAYQKRMEEEDNSDQSRDGGRSDDEYGDEDDENQLLDIEKLKMREDLTDKQKQLVSKLDSIRR